MKALGLKNWIKGLFMLSLLPRYILYHHRDAGHRHPGDDVIHFTDGNLIIPYLIKKFGVDPLGIGKFQYLPFFVQEQNPGPIQFGRVDEKPQRYLQQFLQIENRERRSTGFLHADELINLFL